MPTTGKLQYLRIVLFAVLFSWISFFPEPLQGEFGFYARVFFGVFLLTFLLEKMYLKKLFSISDWPLWLFLLLLACGNINATDKTLAFKTYTYIILTFFLVFYIGKGIFISEKGKAGAVLVICILSGIVALIALLELYFGKNILYEKFIENHFYQRYSKPNMRLMATQFNPVILGSFLIGCLPFNFLLCGNKSRYFKTAGYIISLASIIVIILTFSRGVFLGLLALSIFFLWQMRKKRILSLFLIFLIIFISVCTYQKSRVNLARFGVTRLISGSYDSIFSEYRFNRVKMTLRILRDHPFAGVGLNHFRIRFNDYCDKGELGEMYEFKIPDNMYLTFLAETGLFGAFGFLALVFSLFRRGLNKIKESVDRDSRFMLISVMSAFVGLLVNMAAYELFYWSNPFTIFCLICGFIQGAITVRQDI